MVLGSRFSKVVVISVPSIFTCVLFMVGCIVVAYTNHCSVLVGSSQFSETILITPFKVAVVSVTLVAASVTSVGL